MTKFAGVIRNLDLSFLGEEWKECFLRFKALAVADLQKLSGLDIGVKTDKEGKPIVENIEEASKAMDKVLSLLRERFVAGKALDEEGKLVDVTKEDLNQFPIEVINQAVNLLTGGEELKKA